MKKYAQFIVVMGVFFLLVVFRQIKEGNNQPIVGGTNNTNSGNSQNSSSTGSSSSGTSDNQQASNGNYKDGTYTGDVADAFYGNLQVQVTISSGKITDVEFLQYPNDNPTSVSVNSQAIPFLKQEAIQAQSANVNIVSGASQSSQAFQQSLSSALQKAS